MHFVRLKIVLYLTIYSLFVKLSVYNNNKNRNNKRILIITKKKWHFKSIPIDLFLFVWIFKENINYIDTVRVFSVCSFCSVQFIFIYNANLLYCYFEYLGLFSNDSSYLILLSKSDSVEYISCWLICIHYTDMVWPVLYCNSLDYIDDVMKPKNS